MSTNNKKIGILYTCADWRLHQPKVVAEDYPQIAAALGVDNYDMVTAPGPDGVCVNDARSDEFAVDVGRIRLLVGAHHVESIGVMPHQKCAGHPVTDEAHIAHAQATVAKLRAAMPEFTGTITPLVWRHIADDTWGVDRVEASIVVPARATQAV